MQMSAKLRAGDLVDIDWGLNRVTGRVLGVYGPPYRIQVTVELTPELSSYVVDEVTTVTLPSASVHQRALPA
jgi:uncharacterized Zn finger protein